MSMHYGDTYHELIKELRAALLDERKTAVFYAQLRDISRSFEGVDSFAEARKDELDHAAELTKLLEQLTGSMPEEALQPVCPPSFSNYCEGIRMAIEGESAARVEYKRIIQKTSSREIRDVIKEIFNDEEVHLAKFRKLYEIECRPGYYAESITEDPEITE
ncbi:MAG: ferritin-like domain-containing protein [Clostridia bacterium]|nr:ferritin-like domain-containing protein [Clostridia bacterium]